jgi:hypothetical protein
MTSGFSSATDMASTRIFSLAGSVSVRAPAGWIIRTNPAPQPGRRPIGVPGVGTLNYTDNPASCQGTERKIQLAKTVFLNAFDLAVPDPHETPSPPQESQPDRGDAWLIAVRGDSLRAK